MASKGGWKRSACVVLAFAGLCCGPGVEPPSASESAEEGRDRGHGRPPRACRPDDDRDRDKVRRGRDDEACPVPVATRTVSGAFVVTHWPDSGVKTTVPAPQPPGTTIAALVPDGSPSGYAVHTGTLLPDGSFTIPGVPAGTYFLEHGRGGVASLYELTTSTPDLQTLAHSRPDVVFPTVATPVTYHFTNLDPWTPGTQLWTVDSQASVDIVVRPPAAAGATEHTATFDWSSVGPFNGLPDVAGGDVLYTFQRAAAPVADGPGGPQQIRKASKYAALSGVTIADGVPSTIEAPLVAAPLTESISVDVRSTAFAALAPAVNPGALPSAGGTGTLFLGVNAVRHAASYPSPLVPRMRLLGLFLDVQAPDAAYLDLGYGGFLDPASWEEWWTNQANFDVPVARPRGAPASTTAVVTGESLASGTTAVVAPVQGPVTAPTVNGLDAFAPRAGVGVQPTLSWSAPALGAPTSFHLTINAIQDVAGAIQLGPVLTVAVFGSSFKVPPGVLAPGNDYFAVINAQQAPWDVIDAPPLLVGAPMFTADCVTAAFSP